MSLGEAKGNLNQRTELSSSSNYRPTHMRDMPLWPNGSVAALGPMRRLCSMPSTPAVRRAVYAGSFDPITNGHLWMIREASRLFDELVVAIGVNPEKRSMFTLEQRLEMLRDTTAGLPNVRVDHFQNMFLVNYSREVGAQFIVRGIRNEVDYGFERGMRHINGELAPQKLTVFLMPPRDLAEISSSFVKGLMGPAGWQQVLSRYVPENVYRKLIDYHEHNHAAR